MIKMLKKYNYKNYDFLLMLMVILMASIGVVVIKSAAGNSTALKQAIGFLIAFIIMIVVSLIDYTFVTKFAIPLYFFNIFILLLVKFAGVEYMGAKRWFKIGSDAGGISLQPSELSKILIIICMAKYIDVFQKKINSLIVLSIFCITSAIPIALVAMQTDLSTSIVMFVIFCVIIYVGGLSYKIIGIIFAIGIPGTIFLFWYALQPYQILLQEYQVRRIKGFLYPEEYETTILWQQNNSVLAIGSGQLYGKGLFNNTVNSVKSGNYLSQTECDFIFAVIGEELGFIGGCMVIIGMLLLVLKCIFIAKDAKDLQGKLIASGVATLLSFQSFVNIGVATAILPNTGLPMPLISSGLSSLLSIMIGFGLVLNVSLQKQKY